MNLCSEYGVQQEQVAGNAKKTYSLPNVGQFLARGNARNRSRGRGLSGLDNRELTREARLGRDEVVKCIVRQPSELWKLTARY